MIEKYLTAPYVEGGRTLEALDCWGLILLVRAEMGLPELPRLEGITKTTLVEANRAYRSIIQGLEPGPAALGAVAAVLRGELCLHVGVVIDVGGGQLGVLDTNPGGARWRSVRDFEQSFPRVVFYRDR